MTLLVKESGYRTGSSALKKLGKLD